MIWTSFTGFVVGLVVSLSKSDGPFERGNIRSLRESGPPTDRLTIDMKIGSVGNWEFYTEVKSGATVSSGSV